MELLNGGGVVTYSLRIIFWIFSFTIQAYITISSKNPFSSPERWKSVQFLCYFGLSLLSKKLRRFPKATWNARSSLVSHGVIYKSLYAFLCLWIFVVGNEVHVLSYAKIFTVSRYYHIILEFYDVEKIITRERNSDKWCSFFS